MDREMTEYLNRMQMKETSELFAKCSTICFDRCVSNFTSRKLNDSELNCIELCSQKFAKMNQRLTTRLGMNVTKVVYHIDEEDTPYLVKVNQPPDKCTLRDFKDVLSKKFSQYYFRDKDADFGVVKEEIKNDDDILPHFDGTVKAWLVTTESSKLRVQNIPVDFMSDDCTYQDSDSVYTVNAQVPFKNIRFGKKPARIHKLFQKRRNRYELAGDSDVNRSNIYDSEEESSRFSSVSSYSKQRLSRHKKHVVQRIERIDEDVSSLTDSTMSLTIITVTLNMDKANFLGISIVGQSVPSNGSNEGSNAGGAGIYIGAIMPNGAVALDGHIEVGDLLLEVNGISFEHMTNEQAVATLRDQVQRLGPITLVVAKCWDPNPASSSHASGTGGMRHLLDPSEPARPIDTRAWLAHTNAALRQMQQQKNQRANSSIGSKSLNDSENLPLLQSQLLASHEAKSNLCLLLSDFSALRAFLEEVTFRETVHQCNGSLNISTELNLVVKMLLLSPEPKLEMRDRVWLKILIPAAVLGSDLVDWVKNFVDGIESHKDAIKYVRNLVHFDFLRHPVGKRTFSLHCYYLFTELSLSLCWQALLKKLDAVLENQLKEVNTLLPNKTPSSLFWNIPYHDDPLRARLLAVVSNCDTFNWPSPPDSTNTQPTPVANNTVFATDTTYMNCLQPLPNHAASLS
ncbi:hypothetical protein Ciccas_011726, partial [Cichlidogyrus casuarinus]